MRKRHFTALFLIMLFLLSCTFPGKVAMASEGGAGVKQKIYFQWMYHTYKQNETKQPFIRKTIVDYSTGLFRQEDTVIDFIDTSKDYSFTEAYGSNTKNPWIRYSTLNTASNQQILKYDSRSNKVSVIGNVSKSTGTMDEIYPDANMYVVEKGPREYLVYSLSTNKLIHRTKEKPSEHTSLYVTNLLFHNDFDPEPTKGSLYVTPGKYYVSGRGYVDNPGEYSYEIRPDGSERRLGSYRKKDTYDYVYKKMLTSSTMYKQTSQKRMFKHELIINGKAHTLLESNTSKAKYTFGVAQFSPNGKYVVLWVNYTENGRRVPGKEEYRIFDTSSAKLIQTIPINTTGGSSAIDFGLGWVDNNNTDHIMQSGLLNKGALRVIGTNLMTPSRSGNVINVSSQSEYLFTFDLANYLTINDPVPVKYNGEYMQFQGQGTFRAMDSTIYTPVDELVKLIDGTVNRSKDQIIVKYQDKSFTLNPAKQIKWKNRIYYPLREILTGVSLKLLVESNSQASEDWKELRIVD
ncbi:hypothetical protein [Paenibacillus xylanexedens]|uniref:hypothetical protein n=1 Tax=Paenibacillus xylanexedens TaxID=528191 RepID=UPI00119F99C7|nr:hypothetical protein [Paenibacillus xylanexedens]